MDDMKNMKTEKKKKTLAIIGFGRFGQMMAEALRPHFDVYAYNPRDKSGIAKSIGVKYEKSLAGAAGKDIVVLAMPISSLEEVLEGIAPHLKTGALVLDVCSVKVNPVALMKKILPETVDIIATHPLFGPDSAETIRGRKIMLFPVRTSRHRIGDVERFLKKLGLVTYVMTPEEHDRQMAVAQGLTHYIARALIKMDVKEQELTTPNFDALLSIIERFRNESEQLFVDIQKENPLVKDVRKKFRKTLEEIEDELASDGE